MIPDHGRDIGKWEYNSTDNYFHSCLAQSRDIVPTWPAWKCGIFGLSAKSTNPVPRKPVLNGYPGGY